MDNRANTHLHIAAQKQSQSVKCKKGKFYRRVLYSLMPVAIALSVLGSAMPSWSVLRYGNRSREVTQVQNQLKNLGYFPSNTRATGYFGQVTKNAVIKFQRDNNLVADGIIGNQTLAALEGSQELEGSQQPEKPSPSARVSPSNNLTLVVGSSGEDVRILQLQLAVFEYYKGEINGVFTQQTKAALIEFQKENALSPTGVVDTTTKRVLRSRENEIFARN